jgi:hypothetical protein
MALYPFSDLMVWIMILLHEEYKHLLICWIGTVNLRVRIARASG